MRHVNIEGTQIQIIAEYARVMVERADTATTTLVGTTLVRAALIRAALIRATLIRAALASCLGACRLSSVITFGWLLLNYQGDGLLICRREGRLNYRGLLRILGFSIECSLEYFT
jgi:hypothetical protein